VFNFECNAKYRICQEYMVTACTAPFPVALGVLWHYKNHLIIVIIIKWFSGYSPCKTNQATEQHYWTKFMFTQHYLKWCSL